MSVKKAVASVWDIRLLGTRVPLLVVGVAVLLGGIFGLNRVSETAALLVGGLAIIVILLSFSGSISSWRRAGRRSSVHPHAPMWTRQEERNIVQAQMEADKANKIVIP